MSNDTGGNLLCYFLFLMSFCKFGRNKDIYIYIYIYIGLVWFG